MSARREDTAVATSGKRQAASLTIVACGMWLGVSLISCSEDPVPKPRGYPRLDLPEAAYTRWSGNCPYTVEVPAYALMLEKPGTTPIIADTACLVTMRFLDQRASVFLTCRKVEGD